MQYKLSQIAEICGGELIGADHMVECVVTDSRTTVWGAQPLFVAIDGANHDSHLYIYDMARRGVSSFVVERRGDCTQLEDASFVVVGNSIEALQRLAAHHRGRLKGCVVAITGSNGKSVIKEWIAQSIPAGVKFFRSPRSYNSQLGVALSMLMTSGDEELVVIEAGISRRTEMCHLQRIIRPNIVIFSSIGDAHQEGFDSMEEKIEEKMVLCTGAKKLIYNSDYKAITPLLPNIQTLDSARFKGGVFTDIASHRNSQIVEAFCYEMNYPTPDFKALKQIAMRLEVREGINDSTIINDSYNSDINSLSIAIDQLKSISAGRKTTLILSDILQSGVSDEELYKAVAKIVSDAKIDRFIGVGGRITPYAHLFDCAKRFFTSTEELLSALRREDYAQNAILLKGNRESRFEKISHTLSRKSHTTTLEVNLDAMVSNLNYFRSKLRPSTKLTAMVKASSYGAGDYEIAQTLQHQGVDYLAVAFADEGQLLREKGITMPIIVLNADDGSFSQMINYRLEPEIYSLRSLEAFGDEVTRHCERDYPMHIKLDSGMHRLGFEPKDIEVLCDALERYRGVLYVSSIFSHLSTSDMEDMDQNTHHQMEVFDEMCSKIKSTLDYPTLCHIENSAAIDRFPLEQRDMCRLGIGLYGFGWGENLTPISTLKSRIVQIKELDKNECVGYARAGVLSRNTRTATIPIGYADGLDRHLGCGAWSMMVAGQKAPIVGRICMDSCMIDITDIEGAVEGAEVTIFSPQRGNSAEDIAQILGTIVYEVLTSVSSRVKRIYIKE